MRILVVIGLFTLASCTGSGKKENMSHKESVKMEQYIVEGQQLYNQYCSNCHQVDGSGLAKLYPPLKNSDYLRENLSKSICGMKNGMSGEIVVNGQTYNLNMPGIPSLTELEMAEISTYITNSWGNDQGLVSIDDVKKALKECQN